MSDAQYDYLRTFRIVKPYVLLNYLVLNYLVTHSRVTLASDSIVLVTLKL